MTWGSKRTNGGDLSRRGLAPVVAVVLLVGIVLLGVAMIAMIGLPLLDAINDQSSMERAEQSMLQFESGLSDARYSGDDHDMPAQWTEDGSTSVETQGTISFEINPNSPGPTSGCDPRTELDLETFLHESDGGTLAYQGGGIFRPTSGGTSIVSAPDLSHRSTEVDGKTVWSIQFPMMSVKESDSASGNDGAQLTYDSKASAQQRQQIQTDLCLPAQDHDFTVRGLEIVVEDSPYLDAWERFLEDELGGNSTVTRHGNDRVVAVAPLGAETDTAISPADFAIGLETPFGGVHSTSATELHVPNIDIDGYDSRTGPYSVSEHGNATVGTVGDLKYTGSGTIHGDACVNGEITGPGTITGTTDCTVSDSIDKVDVDGYVALANSENNNDETTAISGDTLSTGSQTLETGVYYLDSVDLNGGDDLEIDTSGGDVVIAVDKGVTIDDADVSVTGSNDVRWFVRGSTTIAETTVGDDVGHRSTGNWLFAGDDVAIDGGSEFVGIVYAPNLDVTVDGGTGKTESQVYGALAGDVALEQGAPNIELHHDTAIDGYVSDGLDYGNSSDGTITGPGDVVSFDARVTFVDAEFAANGHGSFPVSLPVERVDNPDDELDSLEYWQTASSRATEKTDSDEWNESFDRSTNSDCFWFFCSDPSATEQFQGEEGNTVTVTATTANGEVPSLTLSEVGGSVVETGSGSLEATLPNTGTYEIEIGTDSETDYELEIESEASERYYEEITFDATRHDEVTIDLESDETDPAFSVFDSSGGAVAWAADSGDVSETFRTHSDGEYTIRVFSQGEPTPFDYDITLKRTYVHNARLYQQGPLQTSLIFQDEDGSVDRHSPWPETDLEAVSDGTPGHLNDVNHPGVEYPMTYDVTDLPANTSFSAELQWRYQLCGTTDSYAGTTRTHNGETYFEVGCGDGYNTQLDNQINVIEDSDSDRIKVLEDGDEVPDIDPSAAQRGMQDMLGNKLDTSGDTPKMNLNDGEFAVVFELASNPSDPTWEKAKASGAEPPDYNDVVMLYEITDVEREPGDEEAAPTEPGTVAPDPAPEDDYGYTISIQNGVVVFESD